MFQIESGGCRGFGFRVARKIFMSRKTRNAIVIAAAGSVLLAYFGSPLLAVKSLVEAAEAGDATALERRVDFPALRESLKSEMIAAMNEELGERSGGLGGGLGGLGLALAPGLVDGAVETMVTPGVVARLVRTGKRPQERDLSEASERSREGELNRSLGYRDLDTFVIRLSRKDRPEQPLRLLMTRRGLFDWKLSGVEFHRSDR